MTDVRSSAPDDATVVVGVDVALTPDAAFGAFTDSDVLSTWFWPERFASVYEVDAVVGGAWRVRSDVMSIGFTAVFGEVVAGRRLAMSWQWDDDADVTRVAIDFTPRDSGSTVTVTHGANPTLRSREEHRAGWRDCLTRLAQLRP